MTARASKDSPSNTKPSGSHSVAIFGGSFNPPHLAHVLAATVVLATEDVHEVLVVPTFHHPFGKTLAPFDDRMTMCELAMGWIPGVRVSRVEEELGGESRTLRTLEHLAVLHPDWHLRLVMGADLLVESPKWFGFDRIVELAPPIVLGRAGVEVPGAPPAVLPDVSSTDVRAKCAAGDFSALRSLVPRTVLAHIRARALYNSAR